MNLIQELARNAIISIRNGNADNAYEDARAAAHLALDSKRLPGVCEHCGSVKPRGQSCGCFDNGCQ